MVDTAKAGTKPIIIKKYANRRLYNTSVSSYITLHNLAQMTRSGVVFQVLDAKTGADITHTILTQIIMDAEATGTPMLPVSFLCQLIALYGTPQQSRVADFLSETMSDFVARPTVSAVFDATALMEPSHPGGTISPFRGATPSAKDGRQAAHSAMNDDLAALRDQMSVMQQKLDALVN